MVEDGALADALVAWLGQRTDGVLDSGLSADEITRAEATYRLTMPSLWRAVLALAHPVALAQATPGQGGQPFPDWRSHDSVQTQRMVEAPVEGLLFDVEHNDFWWRAWGPRPESASDRLSNARAHLAQVPRLTPLWGHQYVGSENDGPVFSVVQADLFVPALTLAGLLDGSSEGPVPAEEYPLGSVPFWSDLHAYNQIGHYTAFGELAEGGL